MRRRKKRCGFSKKQAKLHTPEAMARREQIIGRNPWGGYNHNSLGCEFMRMGSLNMAIAEFEKAVSLNPWEAKFKVSLARAYIQKGELEKARQQLTLLFGKQPDHAEALFAQALLYEAEGQFTRAISYYARCLEAAPGATMRRQALEGILALRGNLDKTNTQGRNDVEDTNGKSTGNP